MNHCHQFSRTHDDFELPSPIEEVHFKEEPCTSSNSSSCDDKNESNPSILSHHAHHFNVLDGKFFKVVSENSNTSQIIASCVKCEPKNILIKGSSKSTTNFLSHLKRRHGSKAVKEYNDHKRNKIMSAKSKSYIPTITYHSKTKNVSQINDHPQNDFSQNEFNKLIMDFIVHSMVPLRVVDDYYFKAMISSLVKGDHSDLKIISSQELEQQISGCYRDHMNMVTEEIKYVPHICISADLWSSKRERVFGMTAHWITDDLKRKYVALACRRFKDTNDFKKVAESIKIINCEFGLTATNLVATITDNPSNFLEAFKEFGIERDAIIESGKDYTDEEHQDSEEDDEDENTLFNNRESENISILLPRHSSCYAHTLNLCVYTDFRKILAQDPALSDIHDKVLEKCNKLWKASSKPKTAEIIKNILGFTLSLPDQTRWNSLYDALKSILNLKEKTLLLFWELNLTNPISDVEFEYIAEHLKCMKPLAEALDILQGQNNTFYGVLLPCLLSIKIKLENLNNSYLSHCRPLVNSLYENINKKFEKILDFSSEESKTAIIAALSHPRFKNLWFTTIDSRYHTIFMNYFKDAVKNQVKFEKDNSNLNNTQLMEDIDNEDTFFEFGNSQGETYDPSGALEIEVLQYLADPDKRLDCLNKFPTIKSVFKKYNTPIPSSAPVERLFPFATMIDPSDQKLSDELFQKRMILKSTLNTPT